MSPCSLALVPLVLQLDTAAILHVIGGLQYRRLSKIDGRSEGLPIP